MLKDSVLYGAAASISKAFALITFPLLARHLSVSDYGTLDYLFAMTALISTVIIFGQDSAVARYFYEYECEQQRQQLVSQSLLLQFACVLFLLPMLLFASPWSTPFLIDRNDADTLFRLLLLQTPFLMLINFSQNLLKWTFSRYKFLAVSLGYALVQASTLTVLLVAFDVGIREILIASLTTTAFFGILGLFFIRRWLCLPSGFSFLREMLPFAIPFGIIGVMGSFAPTLERSFTNSILGSENLGLYAAGTKIAMLTSLVVSSFQVAWGPFSLSLYREHNAIETFNSVLKVFSFAMCIFVLLLALIADQVILTLASSRYAGAVVVVFPLAMGLAIQAVSWITEIGIGIAKRSYLNIYSYVIALLVTLASILLFAPFLGLVGVSLGVLFGHISKAVISSWLAQRAHPLSWQYFKVATLLAVTLAIGLVAIWTDFQFGRIAYRLTLTLDLLFVLGYGWTSVIDKPEQQRFLRYISKRLFESRVHIEPN